jgi:hypothetical protein
MQHIRQDIIDPEEHADDRPDSDGYRRQDDHPLQKQP